MTTKRTTKNKKNDYISMRITCDTKDILPLSALTEFQGGLKKRTADDIAKIEKSIREYGFATPFFVWRHEGKNLVLDGHGRLQTLKEMAEHGEEIPALPVVYIDCPNEAAAKNLLLCICSTYGEMTADTVRDFIQDIEINIEDIKLPSGIIDLSVPIASEETTGDDTIPKTDKETVSKRGELYELGNSILMCGDSTSAEDVSLLMGGENAEILFTSPPYSDMRDYKGGDLSVENIAKFISCFANYTKFQCVNLGIQRKNEEIFPYWDRYIEIAKESGLKLLAWNVWNKTMAGAIGNETAFFPIIHEWIFVFGAQKKELNKTIEKKEASINQRQFHTRRQKDGSTVVVNRGNTSGRFKKMESVIDCLPELGSIRSEHPATFPVKLPESYITALTNENDIVCEPFGGSGTTLIACEKTNRKCRAMELSEEYCDVIRRRYTKWAKQNGRPITSGCLE